MTDFNHSTTLQWQAERYGGLPCIWIGSLLSSTVSQCGRNCLRPLCCLQPCWRSKGWALWVYKYSFVFVPFSSKYFVPIINFNFSDTASAKKMDDKQWYQFDDSIVSETREDRLVVSSLNTTSCKLAHRYSWPIPNTHRRQLHIYCSIVVVAGSHHLVSRSNRKGDSWGKQMVPQYYYNHSSN